jgi:hypothetical protein
MKLHRALAVGFAVSACSSSSSAPAPSGQPSASAAPSAAPIARITSTARRAFKFSDLYWTSEMEQPLLDQGLVCDPSAEKSFIACMRSACDPVAKKCHGERAEYGVFDGPCKEADECTFACSSGDLGCFSACFDLPAFDTCSKCGLLDCLETNSEMMTPGAPCKLPCKPK